LLLLAIGLLFISLSSISQAINTAGGKYYFIEKQLLWSGIGVISFIIASKIKFNFLKKIAPTFFYFSLILLLLVLIPQFSNQTLGSRRWFNFGLIGIQPSEIFKLSAVIFFAKMFYDDHTRNLKNLIIFLGIPIILIILEPNLSTAILTAAIVITVYYLAGGEITSLFILCLLAVAASSILVITSPYRLQRFESLVNPQNSISYHSGQMILALSSGFWTGKGLANSDQKYSYLPEVSTDSILAIIGEETGFLGCAAIITVFFLLVLQIIKISQITTDSFSALLTTGIAAWIGYQSLINIAAVVALVPLTGIPLPLVSYGGSSLVTIMFALGLVQNVQRQSVLVYSDSREKSEIHHHHRHPSYSRH
jgi:cell division protein FtsW